MEKQQQQNNKKRLAFICLFFGLMLFASGCLEPTVRPAGIEALQCESVVLDGRLDESVWHQTQWVPLDVIYPTELLQRGNQAQQDQTVKAAVVWGEKGIYVGMVAEDFDIQGNKLSENDWIWLEDVLELFFAPVQTDAANPGFHVELQVNPAGTTFAQLSTPQGWQTLPRDSFDVAVHVDGTLNNSLELDKTFSCEWFMSWETMRSLNLTESGYIPRAGTMPVKMRFAAWDINIYSQIRLNRLSAPGDADPHKPEFFRPLVLK